MVVCHYDDGHFFIVPPSFLWWTAKRVILAALLVNVLLSSVFLLNSSDLLACLLFGSMTMSLMFACGYIYESLPVIVLHLVVSLLNVPAGAAAIVIAALDPIVCNNAVKCKTVSQWSGDIGVLCFKVWIYMYAAVAIITHVFMIPVSFRLMKYAAASEAFDRLQETKETGDQKKSGHCEKLWNLYTV
ncbi:unnamed protein product [Caenorhabditis sp. 36 PRJEB53466]|nr:unnamed protein product [Caenorhabditis sp. 36 PRJEB53466]